MLQLYVPEHELWDAEKNEFINIRAQTLVLEHSLVSISKWESKYKRPFLSMTQMTREETLYYIRCMTITQNVDPIVYACLNNSHIEMVNNYIKDPMTATTFPQRKGKRGNREVITSELIYYWMTAYNIPIECQKWHLNRLLTLIRIADVKNEPQKKMSQNEILKQNAAINAARRQRLHSRG